MSESLNNHMNSLLTKAIKLLAEYEDEIVLEWNHVQEELAELSVKYADTCKFIIERLVSYMSSSRYGVEVHSILNRMREDSLDYFPYQPAAERIIHILNLMENATHKVLKEHITFSTHLHPSIHYLFSKISEVLVHLNQHEKVSLDLLCERLITQEDLHINWIARIEEEPESFLLKKIHGKHESKVKERYTTWYEILEALNVPQSTLPITFENELLIFGCYNSFITETMTLLFSTIDQHEKSYSTQWKDAVILFNEWIIKSQTLEQSVESICFGFGEFLPFERCALFRFSNSEQVAVGVYAHHIDNQEVKEIQEQIINIPALTHYLNKLKPAGNEMRNFQPIYIEDAAYGFPEKFIKQFNLVSLLIVPLYVPEEGKMIGGILLDKGPGKKFERDRSLYPALMKFGQSAGELLLRFTNSENALTESDSDRKLSFSPREVDIIKLLAAGASTTEAAVQLYLSEYTVRDYISTIMRRLDAKNRTEVAVKAIRMGIID